MQIYPSNNDNDNVLTWCISLNKLVFNQMITNWTTIFPSRNKAEGDSEQHGGTFVFGRSIGAHSSFSFSLLNEEICQSQPTN